jgi:hypothetical protein
MPRYLFVVYTNPAEGREGDFNRWYDEQHLADVLAVPGVKSARRYQLCGEQVQERAQPYKYLALYEIEADNEQAFFQALLARAGTDAMPVNDELLRDPHAVLWRAL